jgi:hypothetical protein
VANHAVSDFVGLVCNCADEMTRYTTFKFCLDPTAIRNALSHAMPGRPDSRLTSAFAWHSARFN